MSEDTAISMKLDMLHDDVSDMKSVLKDLTVAINRLAVVEERQTQTSTALERAFVALEKVETRVSALERLAVTSKQTNTWVDKAVWGIVIAFALFIGKKLGVA